MACYHPIKGWRSRTLTRTGKRAFTTVLSQAFIDQPLEVPCGQCIGCRLEYSRQWAIRLMHEKKQHEHSMFLTLTYDDKHLPKNGTLQKDDFQKFMKRYRKWAEHKKIRYFHCGEYGENFGRPHYHAIIFGHTFADCEHKFTTNRGDKVYTSDKLNQIWTHGLCSIGAVTFESCAYVARYVTKKIRGTKAFDHYNKYDLETGEILSERTPEYVTMSRRPGIAKSWFEEYKQDVFPHDSVVIRGVEMKPPKYYTQLFEQYHPEQAAEIKRARKAAAKKPEIQQHNTYERLRVRETIQEKKHTEQLQRKLK